MSNSGNANSGTFIWFKIVHVRKAKFTLYIGRRFAEFAASKWQNPFPVRRFGHAKCLEMFEAYARVQLWDDLHELDGQTLGCWCRPNECHGDILVKLRKEQLDVRESLLPDSSKDVDQF